MQLHISSSNIPSPVKKYAHADAGKVRNLAVTALKDRTFTEAAPKFRSALRAAKLTDAALNVLLRYIEAEIASEAATALATHRHRQTNGEAEGHSDSANQAIVILPFASQSARASNGQLMAATPAREPNPPRGINAIRRVQGVIREGLMWTRKTHDGKPWASLSWAELYGRRRDGNLADLLLKRHQIAPHNNGQTVAEIVSDVDFDKAYAEAQELSDAT